MKLSEQTRWVQCKCGKTRQAFYALFDDDPIIAAMWLSMEEDAPCKACWLDHMKMNDSCPEAISTETGVYTCRLEWRHSGRCEPLIGSVSVTI